ncbi:MAG TPA: DinB family protein [Gemmatimonadales bacterium]|jgi:hypothetical protein
MTLEDVTAILERTPRTLAAGLGGLSDVWLDARTEGPESFSPRDVLGHLIGGERTDWIPRARIIMTRGETQTFDPFDRVAFRRELKGKSLGELLGEFSRLREDNLQALRAMKLTPADLERRGKHPDPAFGPVTLGQLLATWTVHDLSHLAQIARVMAKRYGDAVGPWKAYLPILAR